MDLANQLIAFLGSSVSANRKHDRDIKVRNLLDAYSKFVLGFLRKFGFKIFRFPFYEGRGMKDYVSVFAHYIPYLLFGKSKTFYYLCSINKLIKYENKTKINFNDFICI